jgi:hypothetical protein
MRMGAMIEDAKIARLWSNFNRLSDEHKRLILKVTEIIAHPEIPAVDAGSGKDSQAGKTNTHQERN